VGAQAQTLLEGQSKMSTTLHFGKVPYDGTGLCGAAGPLTWRQYEMNPDWKLPDGFSVCAVCSQTIRMKGAAVREAERINRLPDVAELMAYNRGA
jgi:hypothetical protein